MPFLVTVNDLERARAAQTRQRSGLTCRFGPREVIGNSAPLDAIRQIRRNVQRIQRSNTARATHRHAGAGRRRQRARRQRGDDRWWLERYCRLGGRQWLQNFGDQHYLYILADDDSARGNEPEAGHLIDGLLLGIYRQADVLIKDKVDLHERLHVYRDIDFIEDKVRVFDCYFLREYDRRLRFCAGPQNVLAHDVIVGRHAVEDLCGAVEFLFGVHEKLHTLRNDDIDLDQIRNINARRDLIEDVCRVLNRDLLRQPGLLGGKRSAGGGWLAGGVHHQRQVAEPLRGAFGGSEQLMHLVGGIADAFEEIAKAGGVLGRRKGQHFG